MLDYPLRRVINPVLDLLVPVCLRMGWSANGVTLFGIVPAFLAFVSIAFGFFWVGFVFILLNRLCDGLDGRIARSVGPTDFGAYLDIVFDFIFYGSVPVAFALYSFEFNGMAVIFLLFSFLASGSSFMMFAVFRFGGGIDRWGSEKGFYFVSGLIEGSETVIFFLLCCIFFNYFSLLAYIFGLLCFVTSFMRLWVAYCSEEEK